MPHPYQSMPSDRFWRTGVAELAPLDIASLWQPKFRIRPRSRIVTAGSCFAQHFSRALVARGYSWMDYEPGPSGLTAAQRSEYNYGVFSFRTGNIYTPKMLRQWLAWAFDQEPVPVEVWETGGRFYDPFRPAIEPNGFASADEVYASRQQSLAALRDAVRGGQVFVFTMGLTEAWQHRETGVEYAVCPGTIAGDFDPDTHIFVNHRFGALMGDLLAALRIMFRQNRRLNVLLTVSPVPLTATASGQHVLSATSHSKSLLRAVAAEATEGRANVDYFPSYEIITHPAYRGMFFAPNLRSVLPEGVDHVMKTFFADQAAKFAVDQTAPAIPAEKSGAPADTDEGETAEDELRCEEAILNAFAPR